MTGTIADHLSALRNILLGLEDAGESGFEGLIAAALSEVAAQPFRLASSGSQHGRDGESSFDAGGIYFEAKLYRGPLPKDQVLSRITETGIGTARKNVDVWILASTHNISAQHRELYRGAAESFGLGLLVLDWNELSLPPLAVALAAGAHGTRNFFATQSEAAKFKAVVDILEAISVDPRYLDHAERMCTSVRSPAIGVGLAVARNCEWLADIFSSRRRALADLGQPLAPADDSLLAAVERPTLVAALRPGLLGKPGVFAVLGAEGCGKSWLVAQTWLSCEMRPLLVFLTPDELSGAPSRTRFQEILRARLVQQASEVDVGAATIRWHRRFDHWKASSVETPPRLVVVVDGLNQAPTIDWPRWLGVTSMVLEELGGSLVVTSRRHFFDHFVRDHLFCEVVEIDVPRWSLAEVRAVLRKNSVDPSKVGNAVCESLRNPRLLGLAIDLLNAREVEQLTELSDDRLLFEYMRRYATIGRSGVTAARFAQTLRDHAATVVRRLSTSAAEHRLQFFPSLADDLGAAAQSHFFRPLAGHPAGYELTEEGLPLALGLSIVTSLREEEARGRDPAEVLDAIIEPILALDRTADVLAAAVIVASLDVANSIRVGAVLIRSYLRLQNLPHRDRDAFRALAREAPAAFVEAAREACTAPNRVPNIDWITDALRRASDDEQAWRIISDGVRDWLSTHSLSPELRVRKVLGHHRDEDIEGELLEKKRELEQKLNDLSVPELEILHQLRRVDEVVLDRLHGVALRLLAGKPLADFSDALLRWAFSNALNGTLSAPFQDFRHLIQFNVSDWEATRDALTTAASGLAAPETSTVGQWALVTILRATGDSHGAARGAEIAKELTLHHQRFPSWRLVETYCASDPCDPESEEPHNISETAARFLQVDVSQLRVAMAQTSEDLFFRKARSAMARFRRETAVSVHRTFCEDVTTRGGVPRRQGAWGLLKHAALLQHDSVQALVQSALRDQRAGDDAREGWAASQYMLWAAFTHLDGDAQLHVLEQLDGRSLLLSLLESTEEASPQAVDQCLTNALERDDEDALLRVLAFVHYSGSPIAGDVAIRLARLLESRDSMTRAHVLGIIAGTDDEALLKAAVHQWRASPKDSDENRHEMWSGSAALVRAAELGVVDAAELIDRISPIYYGSSLRRLGSRVADLIVPRVDAAIRRAADSPDPPLTLRLACNVLSDERPGPARFDVSEDVAEPDDLSEALQRMSETPEAFRERQNRVHETFDEYWRSLTAEGGRLVLEAMSFEEVRGLLVDRPDYVDEWLELLGGLSHTGLGKVHWLGTLVAEVAAATHPAEATALIHRLEETRGLVHFSFGIGEVSAERVSVWRVAARIPAVREMCFRRLDGSMNDEEIAEEVVSACVAGAEVLVHKYVDARLASDEPIWLARALTASGYCCECAHSNQTLATWENLPGFVGDAAKSARYAHDRNRWAAHWFRRMVGASDPEDFWSYSMLLAKIIDARCELWWSYPRDEGALLRRFTSTIRQDLQRGVRKWRERRRQTLFGQKVPDAVFLEGVS